MSESNHKAAQTVAAVDENLNYIYKLFVIALDDVHREIEVAYFHAELFFKFKAVRKLVVLCGQRVVALKKVVWVAM